MEKKMEIGSSKLLSISVLLSLLLAPVAGAGMRGNDRVRASEQHTLMFPSLALARWWSAELSVPSVATTDRDGEVDFKDALDRLPLHFIENQGQHEEEVAYYAQQGGTGVFFTAGEMVLAPPAVVLRQRFVGADPDVGVAGAEEQRARFSLFGGYHGERPRTDVVSYGEVTYQNLYPGVDLTYRGRNAAMTYGFVVHPGADTGLIRLGYVGADELRLADNGDLLVSLKGAEGSLRDGPLSAYQEIAGRLAAVEAAFTLRGDGTYGLAVGEFDPEHPLVVQSQLDYSTFLGGSGEDHATAMAVDGGGNIYVAGATTSSQFPTTAGAFQEDQPALSQNAFVSVLDPNLTTLLHSTFLGGSGIDSARGIVLDGEGNVYVAGETNSSDFPTTSGAYKETSSSASQNGFVSVLAPTLSTLQYSTLLGGSGSDSAVAIVLDGEGNVYVAGDTSSSDFPVSPGAYQESAPSVLQDGFVSVLNSGLSTLRYSTFLGGSRSEDVIGIALDGAGKIYVAGTTLSDDFPTTDGSYDESHSGSHSKAFVSVLEPELSVLEHSTFLGGSGQVWLRGMVLDGTGNVYVTGHTPSSDFPTTPGAYQESAPSLTQAGFVSMLDSQLSTLRYSTYLGGSAVDQARAILIDGRGHVYVTGNTMSSNFPTTAGAYDETRNGAQDAFVSVLDPELSSLRYSTFLGGSDRDEAHAIAVDSAGPVYLSGNTASGDFPVTAGAFDAIHNGEEDIFLTALEVELESERSVYLPLVLRR